MNRWGLLLLFSVPAAVAAQTLTLNDASIVNPAPVRIGINIGAVNNWDSGQILKNVLAPGGNPGFEPALVSQIQALNTAGTATTFSSYIPYDVLTENVWAGGAFTVVESARHGAELGCTGTIAGNTGPNRVEITGGWVESNVATIQALNSFTAGSTIAFYGLHGALSFLNGATTTILPTRLTGTQFEVSVTHSDVAATRENGWAQVAGSTPYRAPVFKIHPTTNQGGNGCAGAFSPGDIVVLRLMQTSTPESWWESGSMPGVNGPSNAYTSGGSARYTSDTTDLCPACGTQALKIALTDGAATTSFNNNWDNNQQEIFVLMDGTWEVSFWAKAAGGSPMLKVQLDRNSSNGIRCGPYTPALTSSWTHYRFTCKGTEVGLNSGDHDCVAGGSQAECTQPGGVFLSFHAACEEGAACSLYLDNASVKKTSEKNPTVLRDPVISTLQAFHGSDLRNWINQNGQTLDNWLAPEFEQRPSGVGPTNDSFVLGTGTSLQLHDFLAAAQHLGYTPYIEAPVTFSTTDAENLIEYLAAPATTRYGAKRAALGQALPWTSVFPVIRLSYCNECWNGGFAFQSLALRRGAPNEEYYYDYSARASAIFAAMRRSPYLTPNIELGLNLQTAVPYSADAAIARAKPDYVELEGYIGNTVNAAESERELWDWQAPDIWLRAYGPPEADSKHMHASMTDYTAQHSCGASGKAKCKVYLYEWGQGVTAGKLSQGSQDAVNAGAGAGVVDALHALLMQEKYPTMKSLNFFALNEWTNGGANSNTAKLWGATVDMGGATNQVRPQFLAMQLVNEAITGEMFSTSFDESNLYDYPGNASNGETPNGTAAVSKLPKVFAYGFKNGSTRHLVLINTDLISSHTIRFAGTNPPDGRVEETRYAPSSPNALNEGHTGTATYTAPATVSLTRSTLSDPKSVTLPPYSVVSLRYTISQ